MGYPNFSAIASLLAAIGLMLPLWGCPRTYWVEGELALSQPKPNSLRVSGRASGSTMIVELGNGIECRGLFNTFSKERVKDGSLKTGGTLECADGRSGYYELVWRDGEATGVGKIGDEELSLRVR